MPPREQPPSPTYGARPSPAPFNVALASKVRSHVASYAKADDLEALFHVVVVLAAWFACWALPWWCAPLHSLVSVRLFVVCVHDTGHRNLFSREWMNRLVGTLVAPLTSFCYTYWAEGHDYHHFHSNDLNYEQWSQTAPITVKEFRSYPPWRRAMFRAFSYPLALLTAGGPLSIVVLQPLQSDWRRTAGLVDWAAQIAWWGALWYTGSFVRYLLLIVPIGMLGLFLFHAQHTWPETKRYAGLTVKNKGTKEETVNSEGLFLNAIEGSSLLYIPSWMKWFTARIEYHHIHHLNAKVPCYKLRECHEAGEKLGLWTNSSWAIKNMSWREGWSNLKYCMWDEEGGRLMSMREFDEAEAAAKTR